jgi:hypothetical protein
MRDADLTLMRRMLVLRQFPMWSRAELGELVVVAENVVERTFSAGERVSPPELTSVHFVVHGALDIGGTAIRGREALGALEVIASCPTRAPVYAIEPTHTFELAASDYADVLEDNFGLLLATIRDLAARAPVVNGRSELPYVDETRLGLVERMIVLRQQFPLDAARLEALAIVAHAATETRFTPGAAIAGAGSPVDRAFVVVEGTVMAGDRTLAPGDAFGFVEALAGTQHAAPIAAIAPVRLLETRTATLLDVLEDHTDLGLSVARELARSICAAGARDAGFAQDRAS